jgi:1-deoxy-D-xylulose-5-phosphate synthase
MIVLLWIGGNMEILDKVNCIKDLKKLNIDEVDQLCDEIRSFLVENVSKTGGHLASNLGVVELTVALHRTFDMPEDKIIWDVGHQAYVHKILTGRKSMFPTLKQLGGLSGFPKPDESEYDIFVTGHSSTSISAGLGIARARDIKSEKFHVVSVIGDGSLTGGMAFEALNDAGSSKTNLIVILNDNEMSISQNVGSLSAYLGRLRTNPNYINFRDDVETLVKKIPTIGDSLFKNVHKLKESLKHFFVQGMLFEELGFKYIGPVDGHSIEKLTDAINRAKKIKGPVLIHVLTKKGKGYLHAENRPEIFHGIGPFEIETGEKTASSGLNYSKVFGEEMINAAQTDEKIVAITAAMPDGTGLSDFADKFQKRFFDVGIAEQHAVTMAAGLATNGMKPVFAVYSTFLQRAYDQILHDVCIQKLPVMFAIDRAGIVGEDGETHQGVFDLSYLRTMPNMTILSPKCISEFREMLKWCFEYNAPVAIRYPRGIDLKVEFYDGNCTPAANNTNTSDTSEGASSEENFNSTNRRSMSAIELGKWEILTKEKDRSSLIETGSITSNSNSNSNSSTKKIAILAVGKMNQTAKIVVDKLNKDGIEPTLVNCRFIKPMDLVMLDHIFNECDFVFTIEDNQIAAGFGSGVLEYATSKNYKGSISLIGFPDEFIPHGNIDLLYKKYGLDADSVYENIKKMI